MRILRVMDFLAAVLLVACSSAQSGWQQASAAGTVAAYRAFLEKHPNTAEAVMARERIHALQDEQAWIRARRNNTVAALQDYLQELPAGAHNVEAKNRIADSERLTAWMVAWSADTPEALEAFLGKYPQSPQARQAKAKLAQLTGYRVQLAAYRSQSRAEQTRERLQGKYGDVLGSVEIVPDAAANVHLVRSGPMGEAEANNACAKLKKAHLSCEVIKDENS